jgi:2-dehydro-3-deoxygluconokinase
MSSKEKEFDALALGEILLRLSAPDNERIVGGDSFRKCVGGAELNVVSGISLLGLRTGIISKIPATDIGTYAKNRIRFCNVSDDYLIYDESKEARLGVYYYENGAYPRKASVVYDRKYTSINTIQLEEIPDSAFTSTRLFHTSGITLALSKQSRTVALEMIKRFKAAGAMISFDVNFRASLWTQEEAKEYIESVLPYVDILFASEETLRKTFKKTGDVKDMMKSFTNDFHIAVLASTERKVISPKKHTFSSTIYDAREDKFYEEAPYEKIEVVDRIGSGDAYVAGALYGLLQYNDCQKAVEYGNAASAVKNTISGDLPSTDLKELNKIIESHKNIGEQSEMNR